MNCRISHLIVVALVLAVGACGEASEEQGDPDAAATEAAPTTPPAMSATSEGANVTETEESRPPAQLTEVPDAVTPAAPSDGGEPAEPEAGKQPPAEDDPGAPITVLPDPKVPAGFETSVASARADLANTLGVAESEIGVVVAEPIVWPDAGIGCPEPEMAYAQVLVEGFRAVLTHGGNSYSYHAGGSRPDPFLCRRPTFPTS